MASAPEQDQNSSTICCQCELSQVVNKTKPIFEESGEVIGRICDGCRMKNVANAKKCQLKKCNVLFDGPRNPNLRTLPAKFYDLPDCAIRRDLILQFGITRDSKACCNTCYLRISKAVQRAKLYNIKTDLQETTTKQEVEDASESPSETTSRASKTTEGYTGPQFHRKAGSVPFWMQTEDKSNRKRTKRKPDSDSNTNTTLHAKCIQNLHNTGVYELDDNSETIDDESENDTLYEPPPDYVASFRRSNSPPKTRSRTIRKPSRFVCKETTKSNGINVNVKTKRTEHKSKQSSLLSRACNGEDELNSPLSSLATRGDELHNSEDGIIHSPSSCTGKIHNFLFF